MSYTVTVWVPPVATPPPADLAQADALLEAVQNAPAKGRDARFPAFGAALHERFPPSGDDDSDDDAWGDGSEEGDVEGPALTFAINTHGRHFEAAYQYAVVAAHRLGLNWYDPQSGEHLLADGRRLPEGPPIDEGTAWAALLKSDWKASWAELRQRVRDGSTQALHDLGLRLRDGLGLERLHYGTGRPRLRRLAAAVMQHAAAPDEARLRQRLATLKALPPLLREQLPALRERLRAAADGPALLTVVDAEIARAKAERGRLFQLRFAELVASTQHWPALRQEALDGDAPSAAWLASLFSPARSSKLAPPWAPAEDEYRGWLELAAESGDGERGHMVASALLLGRDGFPYDPAAALHWLRRASADGAHGLPDAIERLHRQWAAGTLPARDLEQADRLLRAAAGESGEKRLTTLRRACRLDHPEAWRRLGDAYREGALGLKRDPLVGAALHLFAQKELSYSSGVIMGGAPAALQGLDSHEIDDALRLSRRLLAEPDPWGTIAAFRKELDGATVLVHSHLADGTHETKIVGPKERAAERTAKEAADTPPPPAADPAGVVMLALGVGGTLFVLLQSTGRATTGVRLVLLGLAAMAAFGAWKASKATAWSAVRRGLASAVAAVPFLGLFAAYEVWSELRRQNRK